MSVAVSAAEFWFIAAVFFVTGWACRSLLLAATAREKRDDRFDVAYRRYQRDCAAGRTSPRSLP